MIIKKILLILCVFGSTLLFSQGTTCGSAAPFCSTDGNGLITFRNVSGNRFAEAGPDYGCLLEQPNPAWYYLKIDNDGDLDLRISQNTNSNGSGLGLDVDFIIWGPFRTSTECDPSNLSQGNTIACSFSEDSVENFTIPNAQSGEFYMLVITNYSGQPGFITLDQISGAGSTDCSIVAGSLGSDQFPCENETVLLDGSTNGAAEYKWFLDGALLTGENEPTLTVTASGRYLVEVSDRQGNTDTDEIDITYVHVPDPNSLTTIEICESDDALVASQFNLSDYDAIVLGTSDPSTFTISYHATQIDAESGANRILTSFATGIPPETIFIRMEHLLNTSCYKTTSASLIVHPTPEFDLGDNISVCLDIDGSIVDRPVLQVDLASNAYDYAWYFGNELLPNATGNSLEIVAPGTYAVLVTDLATGCIKFDSLDIIPSSPPINYNAEVISPAFNFKNRVEVTTEGEGAYEFSIDNGAFQENQIFENIIPGDHIISIRDKNGCGGVELAIYIIDFPRFFTPNGDLVNDTWNIPKSETIGDINISIFNRLGALVSQITPDGPGWDGLYNGQLLPSSDYWFLANFIENNKPRSIKGHFSLKR